MVSKTEQPRVTPTIKAVRDNFADFVYLTAFMVGVTLGCSFFPTTHVPLMFQPLMFVFPTTHVVGLISDAVEMKALMILTHFILTYYW